MNKKNWKLLTLLLVVCLGVLVGYRILADLRTDSKAPRIAISDNGIPEISVYETDALLAGVTATDDRDGDVTDSIVVEKIGGITDDGTVTVTYAAFDASGNVAKIHRTVRYTDYESPRFTLSKSLDFVYGTNLNVLEVVGAEDLLDGDIGYRVKAISLGSNSINSEGVHSVRFQVTNSLGDTVELVLPVEVHYSGRYNAQLNLTDYLVYLDAGRHFNPNAYLKEYIARGKATSLSAGIPEELTLKVEGQVDTATPGVYVVSYTVSSMAGNTLYDGHARLIVVVEE